MLDIKLTPNFISFTSLDFVKSFIHFIAKRLKLFMKNPIFSIIVIIMWKYYYCMVMIVQKSLILLL